MTAPEPKYSMHADIEVPADLRSGWQKTVDLMAEALSVPAALVMRVHPREIEVFVSSSNPGNVYEPHEKADLDTGLYCETVMSTQRELLVPDALQDPAWDHNPDIKLGMVSYCGLPLTWPDGRLFGTVCILDNRANHYTLFYRRLLEQFRDGIQAGLSMVFENKILRDTQQALVAAAASAQAANRAKSDFVAHMSHEFRTPMNAIIGLTHLLLQAEREPQQIDRLRKIEGASAHLLAMVNDILDLAKIEAGKLEIEHRDFELGAMLSHLQSLVVHQAQAKGLTVAIEPGDVPRWLRGDRTRLLQALLNYTGNAIKFTERGGVVVRATVQNEDAEHALLRFEVQDSGVGIDPAQLPRLFQAFEQADRTAAVNAMGTGLGLAITRSLVGLMDGETGAISQPGQGSTFWFTARLQRSEGDAAVQAADEPLRDARDELLLRHRGARVLLADDNEINQEVARELMLAAGMVVDLASDGREALALARRGDFDLILMDMHMPLMSGLDATIAIRALPGWQSKPIVALTANGYGEVKERALAAGMSDFVTKPFYPDELYAALLKWLPAKPGPGH